MNNNKANYKTCTSIIIILIILLSGLSYQTLLVNANNGNETVNQDPNERSSRAGSEVKLKSDWTNALDKAIALAWGDMDKDGFLDLAIAQYKNPVQIFKNQNGKLGTTPIWSSSFSYTATSLAWGDMNSDGNLDLALGCGPDYLDPGNNAVKENVVFFNQGTILNIVPGWQSTDVLNTSDIEWADVDNDADLDLVAGNSGDNGKNVIYKNNLGSLETSPSWSTNDESWTEAIALGDLDNNGYLDLVAGNSNGDTNKIYYNQAGTLEKSASWSCLDSISTMDVAIGDIDNDGDLDIAAGTTGDKLCVAYHNNDNTISLYYSWSGTGVGESNSIDLGDVDSDGDLDLIAGCSNDGNRDANHLFINKNNVLKQTPSWNSTDQYITAEIAFGDMDNDGDLDVATANRGSGDRNTIYLNEIDKLPPKFSQYPNNPPYGYIIPPEDADVGVNIINYTVFDDESDPVWVEFQYSFEDDPWQEAIKEEGSNGNDLSNLATTTAGKRYQFSWDCSEISKKSKNVKLRLLIHPKTTSIGYYPYAMIISTTDQFKVGQSPSVPQNFRIGKVTIDTIALYWDYNPDPENVLGYELFINITNSSTEYELLADIKDANSYLLNGLPENTTFYFKILAYDSAYFYSGFTSRMSARTYNILPRIKSSWETKRITLQEDIADTTTINVNDIFYDPSGNTLYFDVRDFNNLKVEIKSDGAVNIIPDPNWYGTEVINFTADDLQQHSPEGPDNAWFELLVEVKPVNDLPILLQSLGILRFNEDPSEPARVFLLDYFDDTADGDTLKFRAQGESNITVTIDKSNFVLFMPNRHWHGTEIITIFANDSISEIFDEITVIVQSVDDRPIIISNKISGNPRKWMNVTIEGSDADLEDELEFSIDLENVLPGLVLGENYFFNSRTGQLSIFVSPEMAGTYTFNATLRDGKTSVSKLINLTIYSDIVDDDGSGPKKGEEGLDLFLLIIIVVILIIVFIAIFFIIRQRKKSLKISFAKCPKCGQTMIQKGRSYTCSACNTSIAMDSIQEQIAASQLEQDTGPKMEIYGQPQPSEEATKISGAIYPKSIFEGAIMDEDKFGSTSVPVASAIPTQNAPGPTNMATPIPPPPPPAAPFTTPSPGQYRPAPSPRPVMPGSVPPRPIQPPPTPVPPPIHQGPVTQEYIPPRPRRRE